MLVLDEAPARRAIVDHGEASEHLLAIRTAQHTLLVRLEQVNRAGPVVTAAAAGHAIATVRIGRIAHRVVEHAHYSLSGQLV